MRNEGNTAQVLGFHPPVLLSPGRLPRAVTRVFSLRQIKFLKFHLESNKTIDNQYHTSPRISSSRLTIAGQASSRVTPFCSLREKSLEIIAAYEECEGEKRRKYSTSPRISSSRLTIAGQASSRVTPFCSLREINILKLLRRMKSAKCDLKLYHGNTHKSLAFDPHVLLI